MRIIVVGDTHGNGPFLRTYVYPTAVALGAQAIVQVGDFGYWEHAQEGVDFLDEVNRGAEDTAIPLYWLRGNHDKVSLCLAKYGRNSDDEGFLRCRPQVFHIPDGHRWTWAGVRMRAFGGAYSIDKAWRLDAEAKRYRQAAAREDARRRAGRPPKPIPPTAGTLWFPEEELTDGQFGALLADTGPGSDPVEVVFSHD